MMTQRLHENIAAISYGIALERGTDGATFYDRHGDDLEGASGCWRWMIDAAKQFTLAEPAESSFDWYLAVDGFVRDIMSADELPTEEELYTSAQRNIEANIE